MSINDETTSVESGFASMFTGEVITPGQPEYDTVREVWNGMLGKRPRLIARCGTVEDIVSAVLASRECGIHPAVRAGGHSVAGLSTSDDVVIDLTRMGAVRVDPKARRAHVEPGATWRDFDAATAVHGLASTGGLISSTGVAGLTLGGGGNFGIVSRFEFALYEVSTVLGGLMLFPWERASTVLTGFRDWVANLPDEASMLAAVMTAPPEPFVPADQVGQPVVAVVGCWCAEPDAGTRALAPMRSLGPVADLFGPMPYPGLQRMLDEGAPSGARNYFRTGFLDALGDSTITAIVDHGSRLRSPMSQIHLHHMGGRVGRPDDVGSAFTGRDAEFTYNLVSTWLDPAEDAIHIAANRALAADLAPVTSATSYVNFVTERAATGDGGVRSAYGETTYSRLAELKRRFDPDNIFRHNHNVLPAPR